jgi:hypothetical protein
MRFCKNTREEANLIGSFQTETGTFNALEGEQEDGTFAVTEPQYEALKNTEQFKRIDWSGKVWYNLHELRPKANEQE